MLHKYLFLAAPAVLAILAGCNTGTQPASQLAGSSAKATPAASQAADDLPGLKELDTADRKLAEKQKYCPVSGNLLGTADMGKPYKMTVKGRVLFLCCDGCEDEIKKDPDKYLKKLDQLTAKK